MKIRLETPHNSRQIFMQQEAFMPVDAEMIEFIAKDENEFALGNSKKIITAAESKKIKGFSEMYNIFIKHNFTEQ